MLWRLNFLVLFLCLSQGTTYILYYICLLHTYFFLMVYVVMRVFNNINYNKWGIRWKLFILAIIIYVVWDLDSGLFRTFHLPFLGEKPMMGAGSGSMWEWYFRSSLDHWSTFLGMIFALNFPITSLFFRKLEAQPFWKHVATKAAIGFVFAVACYFWVTGPFQSPKFEYNQTNAYFGIVPLIAYIYFRNITPWLRSHSLDILHQIGKTTLETYLMQHHIWLTSNAKSLLTLIPGFPKINFLAVTIIYFFLSRRLYALTLFLRGMLLPNNRRACIQNICGLGVAIAFSLLAASILRLLDVLNLTFVGFCSIGFGWALYNIIVMNTWSSLAESNPAERDSAAKKRVALAAFSPAVGTLAIILLGFVWHHMSQVGAAKIQPLSPDCKHYVNAGHWIPVDACNEESRGTSYRQYGISSLGTCSAQSQVYSWGWESNPSSSHCRFVQRDPVTLKKALNHRRITFAGDSVVRHLYHSMRRQLGDKDAGAYNTTLEKHSDFSNQYGNIDLEFRWAPYTEDLVNVLRTIRGTREKSDLVIIGAGSWDCLHKYKTQQERSDFQSYTHSLVNEVTATQKSGVNVSWVTPSTINNWGLLTEEKRESLSEAQLETIRQVQKHAGMYRESSFVLNATSFTTSRVAESYDGVHYPLVVYDAGSQILANAMDWLLPERDTFGEFVAPRPGKMANPFLGLVMLAFISICLYLCDGFMGVSYLACFFVPSATPNNLYKEALNSLHQRKNLPPPEDTGIFFWRGNNGRGLFSNDDAIRLAEFSSKPTLKKKSSDHKERTSDANISVKEMPVY